jgi:hypothetical protein
MTLLTPSIEMRVFVVGAPRPGTTLVQSLLAAHSMLTSFTESHLFSRHFFSLPLLRWSVLARDPRPRLREFLAENGESSLEGIEWFETKAPLRESKLLLPLRTREMARRLVHVLDEVALRRGKSRWIEKTPRHLRHIQLLESACGDASSTRFVHVIRQGPDAVASLFEASRSWQRPYTLDECVARWNSDMRVSRARLSAASDSFVFYEELTTRPESTLRSLFSGLGLSPEPAVLDLYGGEASRLVTDEETWKADVKRPIRPSQAAKRTLTGMQREQVARSVHSALYEQILRRTRLSSGAGNGIQ